MYKLGKNPFYECDEAIFIADVHSEGLKLESLLKKILPLKPGSHLIFLGDLLDWGEDGLKVLELIKKLKHDYPGQVFVIKGNHELMLMEYVLKQVKWPRVYRSWPEHGGFKFLKELKEKFNIESPDDILNKMKELGFWEIYENLIPYYEHKDFFASHAPLDAQGLSMYSGIDRAQDEEGRKFAIEGVVDKMGDKIIWSFSGVNKLPYNFEKVLICGHQIVHKRPKLFKDRVFLDCGAGYNKEALLFALKMPGKVVIDSK